MPGRLSRQKIAGYAADKLVAGTAAPKVMSEVAAFLVDTRRTREWELVVRDIEQALADRGVVVADVTTTHPLNDSLKDKIIALVGKKSVQMREHIDETVLGGVRLDIPGERFDGTMRRKLTALKAKQL